MPESKDSTIINGPDNTPDSTVHIAPSKYRPDIDGLRAIAVIPVVFFHAGFAGFSGGFVGVDIFFVISGFLITSLILPEALEGRFSIITFYERRIRRIFPALFAVMLFTIVVSYCLMWPLAFKEFGQSILAATGFSSNFLFSVQLGYFDSPAETRPLLHTWSLAVEEQFYIGFPLYLMLAVRWFRSALKGVTLAVALISFGISVFFVAYYPSAGFYLAPSRAWELMLGSMLAMGMLPGLRSQRIRTFLCLAGLVLIALAVLFFSEQTLFPGASALVPCLGTALVVHAGAGGINPISRLLSARWLVFCGLMSYSLYLWHWPLIVFTELYLFRDLKYSEAAVIVLISVPIAMLSWRYIEQPFRTNRQVFTRRRIFALAGVSMAVTSILGLLLHLTEGLPSRMPAFAQQMALGSKDCRQFGGRCNLDDLDDVRLDTLCRLGSSKESKPDFVLWGDSHAKILADGISQVAASNGRSGLQATSEGCPPILGVNRSDRRYGYCPKVSRALFKVISKPEVRQVIIAARWALWSEGTHYQYEIGDEDTLFDKHDPSHKLSTHEVLRRGMIRTLDALKPLNKQITIIAPIPEIGWDVPSVLAMEAWHGRQIHSEPKLSDFMSRNKYVLELLRELQSDYHFELIYPHEYLCDQAICRVIIDQHPLYCDDDHLSKFGISYLAPALRRVLRM